MSEEKQYLVKDRQDGEVGPGAGVATEPNGPNDPSRIGLFVRVEAQGDLVFVQVYSYGALKTDLPEVWGLTVTEVTQ